MKLAVLISLQDPHQVPGTLPCVFIGCEYGRLSVGARRSWITQGNECCLQLCVVLYRFFSQLMAHAGLLEATEGNCEIEHRVGVHPNCAGSEISYEPVCTVDAARPDARAETV